ncbi:hypothetical protein DXG01_009576 [Tephrocybe rancida]|nr:hypothetical protein DXG01_009576 [Tephrocybe rancida]
MRAKVDVHYSDIQCLSRCPGNSEIEVTKSDIPTSVLYVPIQLATLFLKPVVGAHTFLPTLTFSFVSKHSILHLRYSSHDQTMHSTSRASADASLTFTQRLESQPATTYTRPRLSYQSCHSAMLPLTVITIGSRSFTLGSLGLISSPGRSAAGREHYPKPYPISQGLEPFQVQGAHTQCHPEPHPFDASRARHPFFCEATQFVVFDTHPNISARLPSFRLEATLHLITTAVTSYPAYPDIHLILESRRWASTTAGGRM